MTTAESYVFLAAWLVCAAVIVGSVWLSFSRTRVRGFLFLGAILVLWPWFDGATDALRLHFVDQVVQGQTPWLFPFSLMVTGDTGSTGWQMTLGEFRAKYETAKQLLLFLSLAMAFAFTARSFKRRRPEQPTS
ncbi:MAG: hypothetical protein IT442_05360 [Phycisphaeraceae bacterium]|nr:hypothetical protein [Phycisphaeraceae bacterium]